MRKKIQYSKDRIANAESVDAFAKKIPTLAKVVHEAHAVAFTVAGLSRQDLLQQVYEQLQQSLKDGTSYAKFAKTLMPKMVAAQFLGANKKSIGRRLKLIYHTNKQTAYAAGRWRRIKQNEALLPYLQYMPSVSTHRREDHKAFYGIIRPVSCPIWQKIYPPNGFGCKCWVRQISKQTAQSLGITPSGDVKGLRSDKGFNHNHDRIDALDRLAKDRHGVDFAKQLAKSRDDFLLDLVAKKAFSKNVDTVLSDNFTRRFKQLQKAVQNAKKDAPWLGTQHMRTALADNKNYAVATLNAPFEKALNTTTPVVWLSEDTLVKMIAHHPELDVLSAVQAAHLMLKNAKLVLQEKDTHLNFFKVGNEIYQATVKATKDKTALFLVAVHQTKQKHMQRLSQTRPIVLDNR